ncbi:MAG: hypothetical protein IH885_09510 [Myxococcales bacterium]|nr:hypothetical protein [Myxococcales bacterium]
MAVRLGFSVAAHLEPDVLLVDEILSVGDVRFRRKSYERMKQLFKSGVTIVFVSHSIRQVERLCSRAILLDQGSLIYSGNAPDVTNYYLNEFAVGLRRSGETNQLADSLMLGPVQVENLELTDENLRRWLQAPGVVKPGNHMAELAGAYNQPNLALSAEDIEALVVYLQSVINE